MIFFGDFQGFCSACFFFSCAVLYFGIRWLGVVVLSAVLVKDIETIVYSVDYSSTILTSNRKKEYVGILVPVYRIVLVST